MNNVVAVLVFSFLIAFHEFGHMWVALKMGMRVERFSIGFGPVLFSFRRKGIEYALSAIPFGGYVSIAGMAQEETPDPEQANDPMSYANKPAWRRFLVISAGPAANYLLSFIVGIGLLTYAQEAANLNTTKIGSVRSSSAAAKAGLQPGDEVKSVAGLPVSAFEPMRQAIDSAAKAQPNTPLAFEIVRGGQPQTLQIQPSENGGAYVIGVGPWVERTPGVSFFQAIPQSASKLVEQTVGSATMLYKIATRQVQGSLSGPIGIISQTAEQAKKGAYELFTMAWMLSIAVGFFNLLPVPGLDGGRLVFLVYELVARRPVNQKVEQWIHAVGVVALLLLIAFVSYGDIMRKIRGG